MPDFTFPVLFDDARISSGIGARSSPVAGASTYHKGIDIAAPTGTPVVAPTDLNVTYAGQASGYGNVIYASDTIGNQYRFAHLDSFGVGVGDTISQGGYLGAVGSTGVASGSHLHFEVRDAAGNLLKDATNAVVNTGKKLVNSKLADLAKEGINAALKSNPITAPYAMAADALGINPLGDGDSCGINPICHLQKWFEETDFVKRLALWLIGIVFVIGGIMFLGLGYKPDIGKVIGK